MYVYILTNQFLLQKSFKVALLTNFPSQMLTKNRGGKNKIDNEQVDQT